MSRNLQEQLMVKDRQIFGWVLFSARKGKNVGCIGRMRQQNFAMQQRHWSATSAEAWRLKETNHSPLRQLIRMVRDNRFISAPRQRVEIIRWFRRRLSVWSIVNWFLAAGYQSRSPAGCPRLTLDHRRRHRVCGRTHRRYDVRYWRHRAFSDKSRFTLFHSDGRARVLCRQGWRLRDACIQHPGGNRGPSVMVCDAIHHGGKSELVVLNGTLNCQRDIGLVRDSMRPWATGGFWQNFVYDQDNATPHIVRDTAALQVHKVMEVMDWPAWSPDMKPIEHVWNQMGVWVRDMDDLSSTGPKLWRDVLLA